MYAISKVNDDIRSIPVSGGVQSEMQKVASAASAAGVAKSILV